MKLFCCLFIIFSCEAVASCYSKVVSEASKKYGISIPIIQAVIHQESRCNKKANSHAGAMGLMQLMPGTAKDLKVHNPYNPQQNIFGGTKYLRLMMNEFKGDLCFSLAAYNWGIRRVKNLIRKQPNSSCNSLRKYMPNETRNYTRIILSSLGKNIKTTKNSFVRLIKDKPSIYSEFEKPKPKTIYKISIYSHFKQGG